jgi:hypothetical protein
MYLVPELSKLNWQSIFSWESAVSSEIGRPTFGAGLTGIRASNVCQ